MGCRLLAVDHVADQKLPLLRELDLVSEKLCLARGTLSRLALKMRAQVALGDAPARPRPLDTRKINAELFSDADCDGCRVDIALQEGVLLVFEALEVALDVGREHRALGPGTPDLREIDALLLCHDSGAGCGAHAIGVWQKKRQLRDGSRDLAPHRRLRKGRLRG